MDVLQIRHVAALAELSLSEDEEVRLAAEMTRIVAYVAELAEVDTDGVPPMTHVAGAELAAPLRPDDVQEGLAHEAALAAAPKAEHGGFAVPTFVE
jgi:aspartyl-tRNA(Asn)/glutamyl-tRNA(Gln) amidotransferase subunit C